MAFNLGCWKLEKEFVKLKAAIDAHNYTAAGMEAENSLWCYNNINRCLLDKACFLSAPTCSGDSPQYCGTNRCCPANTCVIEYGIYGCCLDPLILCLPACCSSGSKCCGNGICCSQNYICADNACCPPGSSQICGKDKCCSDSSICCEGGCCPNGSACCGDGCCQSERYCCGNTCCPPLSHCCGNECCD